MRGVVAAAVRGVTVFGTLAALLPRVCGKATVGRRVHVSSSPLRKSSLSEGVDPDANA